MRILFPYRLTSKQRFDVGYATKIIDGLKREIYIDFWLSKREGNLELIVYRWIWLQKLAFLQRWLSVVLTWPNSESKTMTRENFD